MTIETHVFTYMESIFDERVQACCSCGWDARTDDADLEAARETWDDHCDQVFYEEGEI